MVEKQCPVMKVREASEKQYLVMRGRMG